MEIGNIVRIIKQPKNLLPKVVGEVGYIESIENNWAIVYTLREDGEIGGCGSIELDYLEKEEGSKWIRAKEIRDKKVEERFSASRIRNEMIENECIEIGKLYGLSSSEVREIHLKVDRVIGL